jgi:FAD/FMN-containing dehydrogenase
MHDTTAPVLGEATIQELRESVRGTVLTAADDGYDEARTIWNGMHDDKRPALVVRCHGSADVAAAVGFARSASLSLAVRGGGHSIAGYSTCDGGIVVDLSPLRYVRIDPVARRAYVGGGAVWADVDHESQVHGLATTGGLISSTGVAGFTLGGGIGWLMRKHGLACDNLVGADVVLADGRLVHASPDDDAELLWGLRGGGGNFGVVTQFEFSLHPIGPLVYAGPIFYPADAAGELLRAFAAWAPTAPDEITSIVNLTSAPPLPVIPEAWHGRKVAALIAVSAGAHDAAAAEFERFRALADPVADLLGPMPYTVMQSLIDPLWQKGIHSYFTSANLAGLDERLIERLAELHLQAPGPQCEIHVHQMGGAVARVDASASAFGDRSMPFLLNVVTGWHDPDLAEAHIAWARSVVASAESMATGRSYVNFLGDRTAARHSYEQATYERLARLKDALDPTNLFRLNQNIAPGA